MWYELYCIGTAQSNKAISFNEPINPVVKLTGEKHTILDRSSGGSDD